MTVSAFMRQLIERYRTRDRGALALRRGIRCAIVTPGSFALCLELLHNPAMATFAAFGGISTLLFVDFSGSLRDRARSQAALVVVGCAAVCVATLCSRSLVLAVVSMAVVGIGIIFSGVVSASLASATNALLLAFILPVSSPAPISELPDRVAGWGIAGGLSLLAVTLLWPAPASRALQQALVSAVRAVAACVRSSEQADGEATRAELEQRLKALAGTFLAAPTRPTGLTTEARATVRLVDELRWLGQIALDVP